MNRNRLKARLKNGEATLGSWLSVGHPTVAEVMGQAGYDWLIMDMEHGVLDIESVFTLTQVLFSTSASPVVRVPWNDPVAIKRVLEAAPSGLLVPQVNSASEAEAVVRSACYPPRGIRGIGAQRGAGFGAHFDEYLQAANHELLIGVQIEHVDAVSNVRDIVQVEGLDLVFIGANDLSASMGLLGQPRHARVLDAIHLILETGREAGLAVGLMASDPADASGRIAEGFQFVGIGHDVGLLSQICRQHCTTVERGSKRSTGEST